MSDQLERLTTELKSEFNSLASWWLEHVVNIEAGSVAGEVSNGNQPDPEAGKSLVFVARLLWFFSAAYRYDPRSEYQAAAALVYKVLEAHFQDHENGGLIWSVDAHHQPRSCKKQCYGQAFAVYGLSEYAMAFGSHAALEWASRLVDLLEQHAHDRKNGGYLEALGADWKPLADVRLGASDINAEKTMNTHLHILEAYTNFYRARPSDKFSQTLSGLLTLFLQRFIEPTGEYLARYYTRDWTPIPAARSFGHDIEAAWLLWETATELGDSVLQARVLPRSIKLADGVKQHGTCDHGGVINEWTADGISDNSHIWWVQAEAMVGFFNAWQLSGDRSFLDASMNAWAFTRAHQCDQEHGEWLWFSKLDPPAEPIYKAGQWKAPYHNGRALLEMIFRLETKGQALPESLF